MLELLGALGQLLIASGVAILLIHFGGAVVSSGRTVTRRPMRLPSSTELLTQWEALEAEALEVIRAHPEGIRLVEIGEALEVEWRGLIAPINRLLEQGHIAKEGRLYFPS